MKDQRRIKIWRRVLGSGKKVMLGIDEQKASMFVSGVISDQ